LAYYFVEQDMKACVRIIVLSLLCLKAAAQETVAEVATPKIPRLELGLKAGLNYNTLQMEGIPAFSIETKTGYVGGAFASLAFNDYLGLKAEALISQKSFSGSNHVDSSNYVFTRSAAYLDFPLLLQIKPAKWLHIVVGPQYSYLVSVSDRVKGDDGDLAKAVKAENTKISYNNIGGCAGIEFTFKRVWVWGRYNVDFESNNWSGTNSLPAYKNEVYQVGVGFSFFRL
jgi:hypothetical protein